MLKPDHVDHKTGQDIVQHEIAVKITVKSLADMVSFSLCAYIRNNITHPRSRALGWVFTQGDKMNIPLRSYDIKLQRGHAEIYLSFELT